MSATTPHKPGRTIETTAQLVAARLQRAVLKLSFSFYGQNSELDDRLKRLGAIVKSGRKDNGVQALIDEVVDVIVAKDIAKGSNEIAGQKLAQVLERLPADGDAADRSRALQRRLVGVRAKEELDRYTVEVGTLIQSLLHTSRTTDEAEATAGLPLAVSTLHAILDRLQAPAAIRGDLDGLRQRIDRGRSHMVLLGCAEEAAELLSSAMSGADDTGRATGDIAAARTQLTRLLAALDVPDGLMRESMKVRALLDGAGNADQLAPAIHELGNLLGVLKTQMEQELENLSEFLRTVTRRLEEFRISVAGAGEVHDQALQSTAAFQRVMNRQVATMRGQVEEEKDLGRLKVFMIEQLEGLEGTLNTYARTEQTRHTDAQGQITAVLTRLADLETETQQLRTDLDEQHALSLLDPLTGVFNRMGYNEGMGREYTRWRRYGGTLSIAVFDLDHFKTINDRFGHAAGDKVLASVASLIRKQTRSCDVLCRFGGEEFVLIMPGTALDSAIATAQKLRAGIAASQFRFKEQPVPVTISVGVGEFHDNETVEEVFERADRALYQAKRNGRNCCCSEIDLATSEPASPVVDVIPSARA